MIRSWGVAALLCLAGTSPTWACPAHAPAAVSEGDCGQRARQLVAEGAFLLDVRTPEEFAEGHIAGAINIPIQVLAERLGEVPIDRVVVVYCRSGNRSGRAAQLLTEQGRQVFDLGAMSSWPNP